MEVRSYRDAWLAAKAEHRLLLAFNTEAHALAYIADHAIAEMAAEIERLTGELDGYQGRAVMHCMDRDLDGAMMTSLDEPDGTILRATDTGREMVLHDRAWLPR